MIVRESPSPRRPQPDVEWPPRSPHAAMAASPSGRKRLEKYYQHRRNVSPSPRKQVSGQDDDPVPDAAEDGSEDEETLQLELRALEAKIKLRKLQKQKGLAKEASHIPVEVPSSPRKQQRVEAPVQQSPKRTQLGIDKGLTAADISLKSMRRPVVRAREVEVPAERPSRSPPKSTSFAERLLASRTDDRERESRQRQTAAGRSKKFGTQVGSDSSQKENSSTENPAKRDADGRATTSRSKEQQHNKHRPRETSSEHYKRSKSDDRDEHSGFALSKRNMSKQELNNALQDKEPYSLPKLLKEVVSPHYDPPDVDGDYVVYGILASKSKPYDHALKDMSTSSNPDDKPQRSKFMVLHLTDLKWEIDLFLFGEGFETFWKLTTGTVLAILNPGIMPPKPHQRDTGKFSLKLGSSEDTVLEIGIAADLAFCKSVKSDGQVCGQWVDGRETEFCEFHVGLQVARSKSSRMEINTMGSLGLFSQQKPKRGGGRGGGRGGSSGFGGGRGRGQPKNDTRLQGQYRDREARESAFVVPAGLQRGLGVTKLLDQEDYGPGAGLSAAERSQKRRAAHEKERDLARALGSQGNGIGVEYLRSTHEDSSSKQGSSQRSRLDDETKDATSYGLVRSSADPINLNPVNGRRSRKEAVGWSKAFKRGLSPTATTKSLSPKKARFMIHGKGLRTPGADSSHEDKIRKSADGGRPSIDLDDGDLELV